MMLWKKSVGESRVNCSRVRVLPGRITLSTEKTRVSRWKMKEPRVDRRAELARRPGTFT